MTSYSVTFLMPVYNSEAYLKQAIDSLLYQCLTVLTDDSELGRACKRQKIS